MAFLPSGIDPSIQPLLIAALIAVLLVSLLARRVPVLGRLVSLASWLFFVGLLVLVLFERQRLDPYLGRFASRLNIDRQTVEGGELRVPMSPDGHFWVRARIGGVERRLMVDSGATVTALSVETARAAGLDPKPSVVPVLLRTANGTVRAETAVVPELRLGNIVARELAVVVSPAFGELEVLGMNFLSRLASWRVEGNTLILVPHHPQPVEGSG
jgi:aspartyl protease family protein